VSPDAGGVGRARVLAKRLEANLAIIDKRRPAPNVARVLHVIGDVKDRDVVIVDDMVDTAGTLIQSVEALIKKGACKVFAACTHPVLSGEALDRIENSQLEKIIVTDTIPLNEKARSSEKILVISVAELFGEAIRRISRGHSVSSLFV
jgi:ribose-phosphate pyrophosphokinase